MPLPTRGRGLGDVYSESEAEDRRHTEPPRTSKDGWAPNVLFTQSDSGA